MDVNLMYDTESTLAILNIIEDVKENDIESLKQNIKILNNDTMITEPLNEVLGLNILVERYPNESVKYLIENLIPLRNQEQLLWNREVILLSQDYDPMEIENFIKYNLEKHPYPWKFPQYQINSMIRLAIVANNFNILSILRDRIQME